MRRFVFCVNICLVLVQVLLESFGTLLHSFQELRELNLGEGVGVIAELLGLVESILGFLLQFLLQNREKEV